MSLLADHQRWLAGCRHVSNRGTTLTPGDIVHCGLSDYVETMRCPNGLPVDLRTPDQVAAWRERIERARRDIRRHTEACKLNAIEGTGVVFTSEDVAGIKSLIEDFYNERT